MESDRFQLVRFRGTKLGRRRPLKLALLREQENALPNHGRGSPKSTKPVTCRRTNEQTIGSGQERSYVSMFVLPDDSSTRRRPYTTPMCGGRARPLATISDHLSSAREEKAG